MKQYSKIPISVCALYIKKIKMIFSIIFRNICGVRARVELSSGKVRPKPWLRGGRGPSRSE